MIKIRNVCNIEKLYGDNGEQYLKSVVSYKPYSNEDIILQYLKSGKVVAVAAGMARDILTGQRIKGELVAMSDGVYSWRSDIIYYVERYNMKLYDDFEKYVTTQNKNFE